MGPKPHQVPSGSRQAPGPRIHGLQLVQGPHVQVILGFHGSHAGCWIGALGKKTLIHVYFGQVNDSGLFDHVQHNSDLIDSSIGTPLLITSSLTCLTLFRHCFRESSPPHPPTLPRHLCSCQPRARGGPPAGARWPHRMRRRARRPPDVPRLPRDVVQVFEGQAVPSRARGARGWQLATGNRPNGCPAQEFVHPLYFQTTQCTSTCCIPLVFLTKAKLNYMQLQMEYHPPPLHPCRFFVGESIKSRPFSAGTRAYFTKAPLSFLLVLL